MAQNINAKGGDWADNKLCSVGGLLAAALWMWCAGLSNLSTAICRAWREKYECVKSWNPPSRPVRLCSWHQGRAHFPCSSQLLPPAPLTASFTTYPEWRQRGFLESKFTLFLLHSSWGEVGMDSESPQGPGKRDSFLLRVQSCPPGLVAAACVTCASLLACSPWGRKALAGFAPSWNR